MRAACTIATLSVALVGCTTEVDKHQADSEQEQVPTAGSTPLTTANAEYQWAANLIQGAEYWQTVTASAVPAHQQDFGLCRAPIPGIDDRGPHNAYTFDDLFGENRDKTPKSPANQFIVNPIGRGHFYSATASRDPAAPTPLPVGTVIIKEKYNQIEDAETRTNPKAFGVMIKQEAGFDTEHGDWEYAYITIDQPNKITGATRGKLGSCIDCHSNRVHTDYVFKSYPLIPAPQ